MTHWTRPLSIFALLIFSSTSHAANAKFGAVAVGGVSISGLDQTAAARRLKRELAPRLDKRIGLAAGTKIVYRKRSELGFSLNIPQMLGLAAKGEKRVPISFEVDTKRIAAVMGRLAPKLSSSPRDARPILVGSKVNIRPEVKGKTLDASKSAARLKIEAEKHPAQTRFELAVNETNPVLGRERLKGINGIIGTFTTHFNAGQVKVLTICA